MKKTLVLVISFFSCFLLNGQTKKLHSIYSNFQGKGNITFMAPLDLGVSFNTKQESKKFTLGLSGYYPNTLYYANKNIPNYNYYSYQVLSEVNDTVNYQTQGLTNQGFGVSIGYFTNYKLFKNINLLSGVTLSNMVNFKRYYNRIGWNYTNDSGQITSSWPSDLEVNEEVKKVSYVPVFRTFLGAEFNMGEHLQLIPRFNVNFAFYNSKAFEVNASQSLNMSVTLLPSMMLGYKF